MKHVRSIQDYTSFMTVFYSLASHERTLAMLLAYFYDHAESKYTILEMGAKLMSPSLASNAFEVLVKRNLVKGEKKYHYTGPLEYMLQREQVFPALFELFESKNLPLLKSIRSAFWKRHNIDKPSYSVRQMIWFISPNQSESRDVRIDIMHPSLSKIGMMIDNVRYKRVFNDMPDSYFISYFKDKMLTSICQDEMVDWGYMKEFIFNRRANKKISLYGQILQSMFAFFYFLATGNVCIDLESVVADQFTLQIIAIKELYKGNYEQAYKIYAKVMTANNQVAPEKGIFVNPVCNYYFAFTSIMQGTETALKKITTMSKRNGANPSWTDINYSSFYIISPLKQYFCDKSEIRLQEHAYISFCKNRLNTATAWLTRTIYQRFGVLPEKTKAPKEAPNWAYLKHETGLAKDDEEAAEIEKRFQGKPLSARLNIKSVWQMRLENLIEANVSSANADIGEKQETMLVYLLRYNAIVPILKKRLKNGNWSIGRELSIRELKSLKAPGLDETDNKLIKDISDWNYKIYIDSYIHLLVGCDHVYIGSNYDLKPVSIHEEKPFLIIDKKRDGTFKVSTNIEEMLRQNTATHFYKKNTGTDYSVFFPTPFEFKTYRELLAQQEYPAEAEPLLIKLITALGGKTEIHSNMVAELDDIEQVDVPSLITLRILPTNAGMFEITAIVQISDTLVFVPGHGNITTIAEREGKKVQLVRSLKAEKKNMKRITEGLIEAEACDENEKWLPVSITDAITLSIDKMLPFMQWCKKNEDICTMEWAEGHKLSFHPAISSRSANISFKQKNSWFEVEGNVEISEGQVISLQKLLELMRQSSKQKFIRIGDNEYITLSNQLARILKRLDTVTSVNRSHLQMAPAAVSLLSDLLDDKTLNLEHNTAIDELRQRIKESSKAVPTVPKTLKAQLRDYQETGFGWMSKVTAWGAGVCLADDMGLGKTLQTIALLLEQSCQGPSLVVAPASVVPNWRNELKRFSPTLNVILLNQSEDRAKNIKEAQAGDIVITTYALLNIQQEELTTHEWNVVCLDEAHTIKNANTKMSKAAMRLQARRKVILTGTPVQNHLAELWNLFQFINPGLLGSADQFKKKFIHPIEGEHDRERQNQLRRLISPFLLRRTKGEVIEELPEKNEIKLPVELSPDEMTMYEVHRRKAEVAVRADKSLNGSTLAEITRLRQMACSCSLVEKKWQVPSSKMLAFIDLAESLSDSGNRALVFSQFTSFFGEVRKAMDKAKLPYLYLDGSTPMAKREQLVKDFQSGKCPFFLISLKAGGLGLNLTGANYVIHLDPWWNPAIEQQATDRAYRIGQQEDVTVYHLISQHTIEEKILRLHKTKRDLADSLLEGSDMAHAITQEEMLELLQKD